MNSISHCVLALLRRLVSLGAPGFSALGIIVSAYGTYLITRFFHAMPKWDFAKSAMYIAWLYITRRSVEVKKLVGSVAKFGKEFGSEDKQETLAGLYVVFAGLVLQGVGDVLWVLDAVLPSVSFHS